MRVLPAVLSVTVIREASDDTPRHRHRLGVWSGIPGCRNRLGPLAEGTASLMRTAR